MSGTRQAICVCVSAVPTVLSVMASCVPPPQEDDPVAMVLAHDLQPERVAVERARGVEVL
jgi:hypothetical protein